MITESELLDDQSSSSNQNSNSIIPVGKIDHINQNSIYYKGVTGLILCIVPGAIIGLIFIKLSLDQARDARTEFNESPEKYTHSTIEKVNKGRNLALIGLGLFVIEIIGILIISSIG